MKNRPKIKELPMQGSRNQGKSFFFFYIKLKTSNPETFKNKSLSSKYKSNADSYEERKQRGLVDVGINLDLECDLDKSFDSQDTISVEITKTEVSDEMSIPAHMMLEGYNKKEFLFRYFFGIEITGKRSTSVQIHLGYK